MFSVDAVVAALELTEVAPDTYRAGSVQFGHSVVHGGQLMAQSVVAGLRGHDGKTVKTLHTVFPRSARPDVPLDVSVSRVNTGRTTATSLVTISQAGRVCVQSSVFMTADEPDFIRHGDTLKPPPLPSSADQPAGEGGSTWQVVVVDGVDISDPDEVGPAELDVWTRWPGAPSDSATNQAMIAFSTDGFLIGTAMRPHQGVGQAQSHRTVSTGVLSHTITFHEPAEAKDWLLLAHRSLYAGRGRAYGQGNVFRDSGDLVASFVQDSMIRPMASRKAGSL